VGPCFYCGNVRILDSVEHPIARALGGHLKIRTCSGCNARANREVDVPLARCDHLARLRSEAGVPDTRNRPFAFRQVLSNGVGLRVQATWTPSGIEAKFLPVSLPVGPGLDWVFVDPEVSEAYSARRREKAAAKGHRIGPAVTAGPALGEGLQPGDRVTVVTKAPPCGHPEWLWPSATAKILLGCIARAATVGAVDERAWRSAVVAGLRDIAFDHEVPLAVWDLEQMPMGPVLASPAHPLVGLLGTGEHLVALHPPERRGQAPLGQVVLFRRYLFELSLPGLALRSPIAWRFDGPRRTWREGWLDGLVRDEVAEGQLALAA
jgi:hypothetical protein